MKTIFDAVKNLFARLITKITSFFKAKKDQAVAEVQAVEQKVTDKVDSVGK